eukprot:8619593-Karenia_brevis.AAC.1
MDAKAFWKREGLGSLTDAFAHMGNWSKRIAEASQYGYFEFGQVLLFSPSLTRCSSFLAIQVKFAMLPYQ